MGRLLVGAGPTSKVMRVSCSDCDWHSDTDLPAAVQGFPALVEAYEEMHPSPCPQKEPIVEPDAQPSSKGGERGESAQPGSSAKKVPVVGCGDDKSKQPGKMSSPVEVNKDGEA